MVKLDGTQSFGEKMKIAKAAKQLAQSSTVSDTIAPIETPVEVVATSAPIATAPVATVEPVKEKAIDLKAILDRMERQDAEIAALKSKDEDKFLKKEHYKGPRNYKFSLRGGIPVLNKVTVLKDPTKPLLFQNDNKQYVSNHYLDLTLADGTTANVENNVYGRDKIMTDPLPCAIEQDELGEKVYVFNTPDFGKIKVLSSCIN